MRVVCSKEWDILIVIDIQGCFSHKLGVILWIWVCHLRLVLLYDVLPCFFAQLFEVFSNYQCHPINQTENRFSLLFSFHVQYDYMNLNNDPSVLRVELSIEMHFINPQSIIIKQAYHPLMSIHLKSRQRNNHSQAAHPPAAQSPAPIPPQILTLSYLNYSLSYLMHYPASQDYNLDLPADFFNSLAKTPVDKMHCGHADVIIALKNGRRQVGNQQYGEYIEMPKEGSPADIAMGEWMQQRQHAKAIRHCLHKQGQSTHKLSLLEWQSFQRQSILDELIHDMREDSQMQIEQEQAQKSPDPQLESNYLYRQLYGLKEAIQKPKYVHFDRVIAQNIEQMEDEQEHGYKHEHKHDHQSHNLQAGQSMSAIPVVSENQPTQTPVILSTFATIKNPPIKTKKIKKKEKKKVCDEYMPPKVIKEQQGKNNQPKEALQKPQSNPFRQIKEKASKSDENHPSNSKQPHPKNKKKAFLTAIEQILTQNEQMKDIIRNPIQVDLPQAKIVDEQEQQNEGLRKRISIDGVLILEDNKFKSEAKSKSKKKEKIIKTENEDQQNHGEHPNKTKSKKSGQKKKKKTEESALKQEKIAIHKQTEIKDEKQDGHLQNNKQIKEENHQKNEQNANKQTESNKKTSSSKKTSSKKSKQGQSIEKAKTKSKKSSNAIDVITTYHGLIPAAIVPTPQKQVTNILLINNAQTPIAEPLADTLTHIQARDREANEPLQGIKENQIEQKQNQIEEEQIPIPIEPILEQNVNKIDEQIHDMM